MGQVTITLPEDYTTADVSDYNDPINAIVAVLNGNIDSDNITAGSLPWSVMQAAISNAIKASAMEHSGNVEKFRDEANYSLVASGLVWSQSSGLDGAMTAGVHYSKTGVRKDIDAITSRTFTASKDTYVYISGAGVVGYEEVANDATAPALPSNADWLAKVVTDGTAITSVVDFRITKNPAPGQSPIGGVMDYWSDGEIAPNGWAYCDGSVISDAASPLNGKTLPDLTDLFTRGTANSNLQDTAVTGGTDNVTLTSAQIPGHTHSFSATTSSNGSHQHNMYQNSAFRVGHDGSSSTKIFEAQPGYDEISSSMTSAGSHTHSVSGTTGSTGSGSSHTNIPAYYGMTKIMRIK